MRQKNCHFSFPKSLFILALFGLGASFAIAQDQQQAFTAFSKLTVGPYDNFESFVSQDEKFLYYSQSQYMSSHIRRLDLNSGLSAPLLDLDADSKSPRVSPDGKFVAFTYYRDDAKGDVCYTPTDKLAIQCISKANIADHSPFWLNKQTIAYLSSNDRGDRSELISYQIKEKTQQKILEGAIFSPNISADRTRLVYRSGHEQIIIFDLAQRKPVQQFRVALPGITGLAHFDRQGRHLYFTQYLLDSNRDLRIDGRDKGAIFRIDLQQNGSILIPEQLSSTDQNCSYPFPGQSGLYVTCAFEGSLDVYKIPHHGIIPQTWTQDDLWEAHLSARSYADRLLLVNRLLTSFQALSELEYLERSLHNLVLLKEWLAVYNYAQLLQGKVPPAQKPFYQGIAMIASTMARWQTLPNQRITAEFSRFMEQQRPIVKSQLSGSPEIASLVDAYFNFMLNQKDQAIAALGKQPNDMLGLFLHTDLWLQLHPGMQQRLQHLSRLTKNKQLPFQTRIYYLSTLFETIAKLNQPQLILQSMIKDWQDEKGILTLIENEIDLYTMARTDDIKELTKLAQGITKRVQELTDNYFALRLLFNRNMLMFARYDKIDELGSMASLWLSYTKASSKEYPFVIEAFRQNTLDTAYSYLHSKDKSAFAHGAFYSNARMSDDLESHYHYARLNQSDADWERLEGQYKMMLEDKLIQQSSYDFVQLVRNILKKGASLTDEEIDKGIKICEKIRDQQSGVGVKYLVLGYLNQLKLAATFEGLTFKREFADHAHRNYLLALDLSWNNDRIRASTYQNLGLLQLSIRNYSLAAEYFTRRAEIPFENRDEELAFRWHSATSLYKANRFAEALAQLETGMKLQPPNPPAWQERAAFYAMNAQQFGKSISYYQQFYQGPAGPQQAGAGIALSYAYSLQMLDRSSEALQWYQRAVTQSQQEKAEPSVTGRVSYHPIKTQFTAYGLMSQLKIPAGQRTQYLQARLQLYSKLTKNPARYQFNEDDLRAQQLKDQQRLALLYFEQNQKDAATSSMLQSLAQAAKDGKSMGYVSQAIQQSFKNALFHFVWSHPEGVPGDALRHAKAIMQGMEKEAKDIPKPSPQFVQMLTESRFFYKALEAHLQAGGNRRRQFEQGAQLAMQHELIQALSDTAPMVQQSLQAYQAAMAEKL